MSNYKIAWRNLWRNKRRTIITIASIFFGVVLSTYMTSMQYGSYDVMVKNVVEFYSGHIQVHEEEYWENRTINNTFQQSDSLVNVLQKHDEIRLVIPRLESFALASSKDLTKGAMVIGIDPVPENQLTKVGEKVVSGNYLQNGDKGILVGEGLANYMKVGVNDSLVLLSQGYHGVNAAAIFPVKGIIKHANPQLNRQVIYMDLRQSQAFYSADERLTSLVITLKDNDDMKRVLKALKSEIQSPYSAMSWEEMQPELVQQIESDKAGGIIMKAILYIIIAFGILGTVMMMMAERKREFGIMVSIGMKKGKLANILLMETLLIGMISVFFGMLVSLPVIGYYYQNPIKLTGNAAEMMEQYGFEPYMFFSIEPSVFLKQALVVFIITLIIAVYPVIRANNLKEINALKS